VNHSHYQHQDPRQINLQHLIEQALQHDDQALLTRLELQWVHRFGVESLPLGLVASEEVAESSVTDAVADSVADPVAEISQAASFAASPAAEAQPEDGSEAEAEMSNQGVSRFTSLLKNCLDDVGRAVDPEISAVAPPASLRPVPAAGPQRLRRWLAPVSQHDLPKAS
jgi:hypothetical protein